MRIFLAALATLIIALFTHFNALAMVIVSEDRPACALASEGIYRGVWVKHRIFVQEDVVYGANDIGAILDHLEDLRSQGLCR